MAAGSEFGVQADVVPKIAKSKPGQMHVAVLGRLPADVEMLREELETGFNDSRA
jgi:hypothetical protein